VAEQYAAVGLIRPQFTTSRLHQPRSTWVHPIGPRES
jgi:hypothetical protein